jgi:hypothetical protein
MATFSLLACLKAAYHFCAVIVLEQPLDPSFIIILHMFDLSVLVNPVMGMNMAFIISNMMLDQKVCRFNFLQRNEAYGTDVKQVVQLALLVNFILIARNCLICKTP